MRGGGGRRDPPTNTHAESNTLALSFLQLRSANESGKGGVLRKAQIPGGADSCVPLTSTLVLPSTLQGPGSGPRKEVTKGLTDQKELFLD